jgi:hypothetical protein
MVLRFTQPLIELIEMSTRNIPGDKALITSPRVDSLQNVEDSTSYNSMNLQGLLQGWLYFSGVFNIVPVWLLAEFNTKCSEY